MSDKQQPPAFNFTAPPQLDEWQVPSKAWLKVHDKHFDGLASAALVFTTKSKNGEDGDGQVTDRVLVIQRAPHDSMPLRWESPGGAVDAEDASILHGCARELWEEAGLRARRIVRVVPETGEGSMFTNRTGQRIFCRFTFEVEVEAEEEGRPVVKLDPEEHVAWYWASREEIEAEKREDGTEMPVTTKWAKQLLLQGFDLRASSR